MLPTGSARPGSLPLSAERVINAYAEPQSRTARGGKGFALFGASGIETFTTCGAGPLRAMIDMNGRAYCVSGPEFYEFDSDGVGTVRGTGVSGTNIVGIAASGQQIVIVNGVNGFVYDQATEAFAQISDPDFEPANSVAFIDQYFAFDRLGTNRWALSALADGSDFPALAFASAESHPDRVLAVVNLEGILHIIGERTIEPWDNTGALSFPFQRFDNSTTERGMAGARAFCKEDNTIFLLGDDRVLYRLQGRTPQRVSNHPEERAWQDYARVDDAFMFSIAEAGHKFIYLTFPTANATWCYDIATRKVHERLSYDVAGNEARWRVNCSLTAFGQTFVGDANSGRIGRVDRSIYTEFGDPIRTVLVSPPIYDNGKAIFMPAFELDIETGVGLGDGSTPNVMLDFSDDGARTWSSIEPWHSMGKIGEYELRLQWRRLGRFYQRTMRLTITDPVKRVIHDARYPGLQSTV